jgi:hypothetical protein
MRRRIHACHMRRRLHACHMRRRMHACDKTKKRVGFHISRLHFASNHCRIAAALEGFTPLTRAHIGFSLSSYGNKFDWLRLTAHFAWMDSNFDSLLESPSHKVESPPSQCQEVDCRACEKLLRFLRSNLEFPPHKLAP